MSQKYLVSFGESDKYVTTNVKLIEKVTSMLRQGLRKAFPSLENADFLNPQVVEIDDAEKYADYPELGLLNVPVILKNIVVSQTDRDDVCELNDNAPFDNINPDD